MKHSIFGLVAAGVLSALMWWGWSHYNAFLTQGSQAPESIRKLNLIEREGVPEFSFKDLKGKEWSLSDFKGKVVILSFWASWCDPCIEEFPSLLNLIKHFDGKVVLLAVSADNSMDELETFLKAFDADKPHVYISWDKARELARSFGTIVLPESYLIGVDGKLVRKVAGVEDWSDPMAIRFFDELLKRPDELPPEQISGKSESQVKEQLENPKTDDAIKSH